MRRSKWLEDWWISYSPRNDNQNAEGTWKEWVSLASRILEADIEWRAIKPMSKKKTSKRAKRGGSSCAATLLGVVERTSRGFELIEFKDHYGEKCSLQASSLAEYEKPGTSAVWLGCNEAKKHFATGETLSQRMHLNREQVAALIAHLQSWLDDDTFAARTTELSDRLEARSKRHRKLYDTNDQQNGNAQAGSLQ